MRRNAITFLNVAGIVLAIYILYAVVWSLFAEPESINSKLVKAIDKTNKSKMQPYNEILRFDSVAFAGSRSIQLHFTITKWVKGADTLKLHNFLEELINQKIKTEKQLQEFKDSNVVFIYKYYDSTNDYTYQFVKQPADYK